MIQIFFFWRFFGPSFGAEQEGWDSEPDRELSHRSYRLQMVKEYSEFCLQENYNEGLSPFVYSPSVSSVVPLALVCFITFIGSDSELAD